MLTEKPATLGLPEIIGEQGVIDEKMQQYDWRVAHIHVIPTSSMHWTRHLAFRDYLCTHSEIKAEYQALKQQLVQLQWEDGNDYNAGKDEFIQREEQKALQWYKENKK